MRKVHTYNVSSSHLLIQLIRVKSFNGTYKVITKGSGNVSNEDHVYNPISENIHFVGVFNQHFPFSDK